jgi:glyoxylase I family protein
VPGIAIGLHANTANRGEAFDECRTGLDHVSFGVVDRDELARGSPKSPILRR